MQNKKLQIKKNHTCPGQDSGVHESIEGGKGKYIELKHIN